MNMRIGKTNLNGREVRCCVAATILPGLLLMSSSLAAQAVEESSEQLDSPDVEAELVLLDTEIVESSSKDSALQLSARQIANRDLSGAATTLERYLIADPEAMGLRAEYALTLCRLDDLQAGRFEVAKIEAEALAQSMADRLQAACQMEPSDMPQTKNQ